MKKILLPLSLITAQLVFAETLPVIIVNDSKNNDSTTVGSTVINKVYIDNSISGNGNISSILETNPNLEVIDQSSNSDSVGEIEPGKISFHNAPFYQNNMQVDGVSNNSLIDPVLTEAFDFYDVPGNENTTFVDLDLIREIAVYDSNISAEYGGFTGGVIDVKTIRPSGKPSFKISYKHTGTSLTELHFSDEYLNSEEYKEPKFEKHFFNMHYSTPINDSTSILASYNHKLSYIPKRYFGGYRDEKRENKNFMVKASHFFEDDSVIDVTAKYSPNETFRFQEFVLNSDNTIKGGGFSLNGNYEKDFDFWKLDTNFAYKFNENSREAEDTYKKWLYSDDKNWGVPSSSGDDYSKEGGFGNINKNEQGISYKLKLKSSEFEAASILNRFKTGIELSYDDSEYHREDNTYWYKDAIRENVNCNGNTENCVQNEQYFRERRVFQKEKVDVSMASVGAYIENRMKYKNFEFTPGLRVDYNNYLKNTDIAYRLNSSFKPFNDDSTVIYGGFNRYYGKSFLGFKLREARTPYYDQYRRTSGGNLTAWGTSADKDTNKYVFSDLETPYTDEKSIGIRQKAFGMSFNLKYVHRDEKNKFSKKTSELTPFTNPATGLTSYHRPTFFTNDGKATSKKISLIIGNSDPIDMGFFDFGYKFSTAWNDYTSNTFSYEDQVDEEADSSTSTISYNGKIVDGNSVIKEEKPDVYNLHLNFAFAPINLFDIPCKIDLNSIVKYTTSYNKVSETGEEVNDPTGVEDSLKVFDDFKYDSAVTLDLKTKFDFNLPSDQSLIFSTEVTNLFDKVQNVENSSNKFKTGRQFWFNLAYKY